MKNQYIGRKLPENGGLDKLADLRTELGDKEGGCVFVGSGSDTPNHTMFMCHCGE